MFKCCDSGSSILTKNLCANKNAQIFRNFLLIWKVNQATRSPSEYRKIYFSWCLRKGIKKTESDEFFDFRIGGMNRLLLEPSLFQESEPPAMVLDFSLSNTFFLLIFSGKMFKFWRTNEILKLGGRKNASYEYPCYQMVALSLSL